jgi:hypothetical protein
MVSFKGSDKGLTIKRLWIQIKQRVLYIKTYTRKAKTWGNGLHIKLHIFKTLQQKYVGHIKGYVENSEVIFDELSCRMNNLMK